MLSPSKGAEQLHASFSVNTGNLAHKTLIRYTGDLYPSQLGELSDRRFQLWHQIIKLNQIASPN